MGDMQTMTEQKKRYTILGIFVAMFLFVSVKLAFLSIWVYN